MLKIVSHAIAFTIVAFSYLRADVKLPSVLGPHAVLQKSAKTRLWGQADPGEAIQVSLGEIKGQMTAGPDGRWQVQLDLSKSPQGPFDLIVEGKNRVVSPDVVVGEVWLCSGQSNMQWVLRGDLHAAAEANQTNPLLRQFQVTIAISPTPQEDCEGEWTTVTPATVGAFTAVGYYFGKKVQAELGVPVGLIHSSAPGSAIEVWMSHGAFARTPDMEAGRLKRLAQFHEYPDKLKAYVTAYDEWTAKYERQDKSADPSLFAAPEVSTAGWKAVTVPGRVATAGLPASGAVWLRHPVTVPPVAAGKAGTIALGNVRDFVTLYWNGVEVAKTTPANPPALGIYKFTIPGEVIHEGENVVALRLSGAADQNGLETSIGASLSGVSQAVKLDGAWLAKVETALPPLSTEARAAMPHAPGVPNPAQACFNFNAMIAPLLPDTIAGIIWYQGEANVNRPHDYRDAFPALIQDLRQKFNADLPFYFCQLPNYLPRDVEPGKGSWADQREAQASVLTLPKTGMATLIDVGEEANLHPRNKKDPGERLARIALANTYGKGGSFSGPTYASSTIVGDKVHIKFAHVDGGLVARDLPAVYKPNSVMADTKPLVRLSPNSPLEGFVICGEDKKWIPADAKIEADTIVVSNPAIPKPVAVRYLWSDSPIGNLYNATDLPAPPFRTDDFPLPAQAMKY